MALALFLSLIFLYVLPLFSVGTANERGYFMAGVLAIIPPISPRRRLFKSGIKYRLPPMPFCFIDQKWASSEGLACINVI